MKRDLPFQPATSRPLRTTRQIFLLEKDTSLLCRIFGLYAARGITIEEAAFAHAAPQTMALTISAQADAETLRVLVAKGASLVGVIEAAEQCAG